MHQTILITGATGKSGRYALERLAERKEELKNWKIRAVVRSLEKAADLSEYELPLEPMIGSIEDRSFMKQALSGVDILLHIAGIQLSPELLPLAVESGVKRIIAVHTTGVYSKYKSANAEYKKTDAVATQLCRENGVALTILRPTMIYGGLDDENVCKFIAMMDKLPIMPTVSGARFALQPVHRRDLGRAYTDVLLNEATAGKNYILSGKEPILLRDMLTVIAGYLHKPARFVSMPYWMAISGAWVLYLLTLSKIDYREKVQRLVEPRAYPHDEATLDFGYQPAGFAEGVKGEVEDYLKHKR